MTARRLLTAGLLAFVIGLVASAPAERLRASLLADYPGLELGRLAGPAYRGSAVPAAYLGVPLQRIDWHWRPAWLLLGRFAVDLVLVAGPSQLALHSRQAPWSTQLGLNDINAVIDLDWLSLNLPQLPGRVRGQLGLADIALDLEEDGWPTAAGGALTLRSAELTAPVRVAIGGIDATLGMEGERLRIDFTSAADNPIDGRGTLLLERAGGYRVTATLRARDTEDAAARGLLRLAGRPGADGGVQLDRNGRWKAAKRKAPGGKK